MKKINTALIAAIMVSGYSAPAYSCSSFGVSCGPLITPASSFVGDIKTSTNELYASGFVHLKEGRYSYAATLFEQAADNVMAKANVSYMAGAANYLIGDDEKAKFYLRRALRGGFVGDLSSRDRKTAKKMLREIQAD